MQQHAEKVKNEMFVEAAKPLIQGLDELLAELKQKLEAIHKEIVDSLGFYVNGSLNVTMQQKKEILQSISSCLSKASSAFDYFQVQSEVC